MKNAEDISTKVKDKAKKRAKRWGTTWTSWLTGREQDLDVNHFSHFAPWFNPNCFSVIISEEDRKKHRLGLWIYEEISKEREEAEEKNIHFIKVLTGSTIGETKIKSGSIEKKLLGNEDELYKNHPILTLLHWGEKPIHFSDIVKKANVAKEKTQENHADYLKKYDIIAVGINNTPSYHVAVYLGNTRNKEIAHIPDNKGNPAKLDTLKNFLKGRNAKEMILNRPIIPFQKPERIKENINDAISKEYGKDNYDVARRNCEHFATLCVTGVKFSSQAENFLNLNFRLDKEKINEETLGNDNFINQIQVKTTN